MRAEVGMDQAASLKGLLASTAPRALRVVAVTSGKGGVGKTSITANLAVIAAKQGQRVLVIDADLGLANVEIAFGIYPKHHLAEVLDGLPAEQALAEGPHGVRVLSAGSGTALTDLDDFQKQRLLDALEAIEADFDLVLVDCGAGIGGNVCFFAGAAQEAVLVVSPEPTSLTDAYAAAKILSQKAGVRRFDVVVNSAPGEQTAREVFARLTQVTSRFLTAQIRYLGQVPRDESVHRAVMAQRPVVDLFPGAPSSVALRTVAHNLLSRPSESPLQGGLKLLWRRLLQESITPEVGQP